MLYRCLLREALRDFLLILLMDAYTRAALIALGILIFKQKVLAETERTQKHVPATRSDLTSF